MPLIGGGGYSNPPAAPTPKAQPAQISICPNGGSPVEKTPGRYDPKTGKTQETSCPPGTTQRGQWCCPGGAGGGGLPGVDLGSVLKGKGKGGRGGGDWSPGSVERPNMAPINPQAEYDPKVAEALARQTQYGTQLEQGSGHAMDVLTGTQADQLEAQVAQARAAAAQAGIPFDEASFRSTAMRGINSAMAQEKLGREQMLGQAYAQQAQTAQGQAGERDTRLSLDQQRQLAQNAELLQRYGLDIQKYGVDAQAATAANNALMQFYSQLMGGVFGMFGNLGSMNMSSQNYYG